MLFDYLLNFFACKKHVTLRFRNISLITFIFFFKSDLKMCLFTTCTRSINGGSPEALNDFHETMHTLPDAKRFANRFWNSIIHRIYRGVLLKILNLPGGLNTLLILYLDHFRLFTPTENKIHANIIIIFFFIILEYFSYIKSKKPQNY